MELQSAASFLLLLLCFCFAMLPCESNRLVAGPRNELSARAKREVILLENKGVVPDHFGTHFTLAFMTNSHNDGGYLKIFIATTETDTDVTIIIPSLGKTIKKTIKAHDLEGFEIPAPDQLRLSKKDAGKGVKKVVDIIASHEIGVYGINRRKVSSDAFLALPEDVATTKYIIPSYPGYRTRRTKNPGEVAIVAYKDNTEINIRLRGENQVTHTIDKGEVFEWFVTDKNADDDLTGAVITSSEPVGVFSGVICANIPADNGLCDHIVEQIPPLATWGRNYITAPLTRRLAGDIFRIITGADNNQITISGETFPLEHEGDFVELDIPSNESHVISCTDSCLVVLYCKGKNIDGVLADPFMMLIPPIEQFSHEYIFATPDDERVKKEFDNYVTLVVKTDEKAGVKLDNKFLGDEPWIQVPGSEYSYLIKEITSGIHFAEHESPIVGFGLYVYGFANYDSYGYPGGLRLVPLYEACIPSIETAKPGDGIDNDCDGRIDEEYYNDNGVDEDGDGVTDESDRARCKRSRMKKDDLIDNDCDGKVDEEKENGKDDDGDGKIDEDTGGCDVSGAQDDLKDGIDKLKGDLSNLMDLLKMLNDLVGPMAQKLMDLDDLAAQIQQCCN